MVQQANNGGGEGDAWEHTENGGVAGAAEEASGQSFSRRAWESKLAREVGQEGMEQYADNGWWAGEDGEGS